MRLWLLIAAASRLAQAEIMVDRYTGIPDEEFPHRSAAPPTMPRRFHANISTVAHLIDETRDYPPRHRLMEVWYDGVGPRLAAKVRVHSGFEENKTFLRDWASRDEYCFRDDQYAECRRSFLAEPMPLHAFPAGLLRLRKGLYTVTRRDGSEVPCRQWVGTDGDERVRLFAHRESFEPVRLRTEYFYEGRWDAVMSWTVERLLLDDLDDETFALPEPWAGGGSHDACKRVMGGWPQLHLLSHYLRV